MLCAPIPDKLIHARKEVSVMVFEQEIAPKTKPVKCEAAGIFDFNQTFILKSLHRLVKVPLFTVVYLF